jgi:hypothetical protein
MTLLKPVSLALAAASLIGVASLAPAQAQMVTNGAHSGVEQSGAWSARQNVVNSERYDRMVATDRAFREERMRKECGPITDPQLHASCVASFNRSTSG